MQKENKVFTVDEIKRKLEQYCVYQDRCHLEVEKKLNEYRLIPEAKDLILLHLLQNDFLNEERFSKSFARGKFRIKKWGKIRIKRELKSRNISDYNIKKGLLEIEEEEYVATINTIAERRNEIISENNFYKRKKKLVDYLYRKGYESNLIFETVDNLLKSP